MEHYVFGIPTKTNYVGLKRVPYTDASVANL